MASKKLRKKQSPIYQAVMYLVNGLFTIITILLGLRLALRLFGASPASPVVEWIYNSSAVLLEPFRGAFPSVSVTEGALIEFSTAFALLIYLIVFALIDALIYQLYKVNRNVESEQDEMPKK